MPAAASGSKEGPKDAYLCELKGTADAKAAESALSLGPEGEVDVVAEQGGSVRVLLTEKRVSL
jgi:hypothetical protein